GMYAGDGSPGGVLNLVRKRPGATESFSATATIGSWNRQQLSVDYSTPSLFDSPFAFRVSANLQDTEFFYEYTDQFNGTVHAILDAPLGDKARVEVGVTHTHLELNSLYGGHLRYLEGPIYDIPRGANLRLRDSFQDSSSTDLFSKIYIDMLENWKGEVGVSF